MPRFGITETAGRFVAGQTNPGVGTVLTLTEKQAEHEVRLGTLRPLDVPAHKGKTAGGGKAKAATKPAAESDVKQEAKSDEKPVAEEGAGEPDSDQ